MSRLDDFIKFVVRHDGAFGKQEMISAAAGTFGLRKSRSVYHCPEFAVRFSFSADGSFSNTVVALSQLRNFDRIPFLVCLVTPVGNRLYLANSTFIVKVSHSSHALTEDNIKGSINGSDIAKRFGGIDNNRDNIRELYAFHADSSFEENLPRLVEATHNIAPTGKRFGFSEAEKRNIENAAVRAAEFCAGEHYTALKKELDERTGMYADAIVAAGRIKNVKTRGDVIEYLAGGDDDAVRERLAESVLRGGPLPEFRMKNTLGDYARRLGRFDTETDIKSKMMALGSNPKAYNIDKFLKFHGRPDTVFLCYFIGVTDCGIFNTVLAPVFQKDLLSSTSVIRHWAGRNSRGVAQFDGSAIQRLLECPDNGIDRGAAASFLRGLYGL